MLQEPGCIRCSSRRSHHVEWPYEKAQALHDKILNDADIPDELAMMYPEWVDKPLLVVYDVVNATPYIVCGPESLAFPSLKKQGGQTHG